MKTVKISLNSIDKVKTTQNSTSYPVVMLLMQSLLWVFSVWIFPNQLI